MSASATPSAPAAPTGPGLSQAARVLDTFFAPSKTFTDIRRSASWWLPWLLVSVISLAFIFTVQQKIGFEQVIQNAMQMSPKQAERLEKAPPEQRAQIMKFALLSTEIGSYAQPVVVLILFVIFAAVLMGTFNFLMGAEIKFPAALAVVAYASLPSLIHALLGIVTILAGVDPGGFNIENPVATNPGYFLEAAAHPALYRLASSLDIFTLWTLVLMGIGFSCISKLKRSTTVATVFGWWLLILLIRLGIAAAFS